MLSRFILSLALMATVFAPATLAQPTLNLDAWNGVKAYYQPGFSFANTGTLSQIMFDNGFSGYSSTFISHGGGAHIILSKIILGGSGYGLTGFRTASDNGSTLSVGGGYGLLNVGYQLFTSNGFSLYPMLGIGGGGMSINSSIPLNKLFGLRTSGDIYTMETSQVVLDLGLAADYLIDFNGDPDEDSGVLVGVKLGFIFVPSPAQWQSNRQILGGSLLPAISAQGPYFSLSLGGGTQRGRALE